MSYLTCLIPCCCISAPDAVNNGVVLLDLRSPQHYARDPLFSSHRARPRTWRNPFGCGLFPCRRNTSHSTCLLFLPSACPCSFLCFSLCLCLCPSLYPCLCLLFLPLPFMSASTSNWRGVVPVRYAPLSECLVHCFPLISESIIPLQPRRVQTNMPPPFWILLVVCQYCCLDRVLKRV